MFKTKKIVNENLYTQKKLAFFKLEVELEPSDEVPKT